MAAGLLPKERRKVLARFLLIGGGISLVLLAVELAGLAVLKGEPPRISGNARWLTIAGLLAAGSASWAFFSFLVYRRLLRFIECAASDHDVWGFAEGAYGLIGVGIALSPALAFFYYAMARDLLGSMLLHGLAWMLLVVELLLFLSRTDELEDMAARLGGPDAPGEVEPARHDRIVAKDQGCGERGSSPPPTREAR